MPVQNIDYQTKQLIVSIISASITFLAVIVALFKDWFWAKIRKPKISAYIEMKSPFCTKTLVYNQLAQRAMEGYYFRIKVLNSGTTIARGVQIYIESIMRKHPDGVYRNENRFLPMYLRWAGPEPQNPKDSINSNILPGMSKYCDLGHVLDPAFRQFYLNSPGLTIPGDTDTLLFELDLEVKPFTGSHLLKIGEYEIYIKIAAENSKPITKKIVLNFLGPWTVNENTMFENAIGIRM